MSQKPISRSSDLSRLRNEGYDLEIRSDHLLVKDIPYVAQGKVVKRGTLVTPLKLAGDITVKPDNHVALFLEGSIRVTPTDRRSKRSEMRAPGASWLRGL